MPDQLLDLTGARIDLAPFIKPCDVLLDVGCGEAKLGAVAKQQGVKRVYGLDCGDTPNSDVLKYVDKFIIYDANGHLPLVMESLDIIVYADILEHLVYPWHTLQYQQKWLKDTGYVIITIPNVSSYEGLKALVSHNWEYQDAHLFDRTHLRFFSYKTIEWLISQAGYEVLHKTGIRPVGEDTVLNEYLEAMCRYLDVSYEDKFHFGAYLYIAGKKGQTSFWKQ